LLTRILLFFCFLIASVPVFAFESFEHSEIGREAFKSALAKLDNKRNLSKKLLSSKHLANEDEAIGAVANGQKFAKFTFGDLVAIYGDYAVSVDEVNSEPFAMRVEALKKGVRGLGFSDLEHDNAMHLVVNNPTHFSLRAAQTYVQWHRKALLLARLEGRLWEALHYEALALHSFTDLFAFGHMHEDRQLSDGLIAWGKNNSHRASMTKGVSIVASKFMGGYVHFYHNAYNWKGAMLKNLAGDSWRGFGDKKYRVVDTGCAETTDAGKANCLDAATQRQRQVIVHAVSLSILDVLRSATGSKIQLGTEFRAMCHLPVKFWGSNKPIPPEKQQAAIVKLRNAMQKQGRPIEKHGIDFSLGNFKFEAKEYRGNVKYFDYVKTNCGKL